MIALYMFLYSLCGIEADGSKDVWQLGLSNWSESLEGFWIFLYFSITAFTAAGPGDFLPHGLFSRMLYASEGMIGLFLSAMYVWVLGRRMSPR